MTSRHKGMLLALLAGSCWGIISLFIRRLNAIGFSALDIAALRSILTALALLAAIPCTKGKPLRLKLRDIWCVAGCGILSITLFNCCYFATMQRSTVNVAVVLLYTSPVFVTLLSCAFFGERFTRRKLLALAMVVLGCVFVSGVIGSGGRLTPTVLCLGLCSGLFYALYSIFGRFAQQHGLDSFKITLWTFIFAGFAALFYLNWGNSLPQLCTPLSWLCLAGLVLISTILPYYTYTAALKLLQPSTAAIVVAIEPVVGSLVGILIFHEPVSASALVGMVLIIGAMFVG
ncbi:MAG: EamA family transporter [Victivallales bacterium]|nr:EamA family transporter [Victivallales bacterium]